MYEPAPGRASLVARIDGTEADAPSLLLLGHTDVVPVTPSQWSRDPFGAELVDGEIWGRGAIDMLNLTSSMAVAFRHLAHEGFRPRGDLVLCAVADEEAGGQHGAAWLSDHAWDEVGCDYVITESGGIVRDSPAGRTVAITVGEKGAAWRRIRVKGSPGHGSMPFGVDNALIKAAEVVRRLADFQPTPKLDALWEKYVEHQGFPDDLHECLLDPERIFSAIGQLDPRTAKHAHACTHTTFSPTVIHGGVKTNVIPDEVVLEVDIRTVPGDSEADVARYLADALGDLAGEVEVAALPWAVPTASESSVDTPLFEAIGRSVASVYPRATLLPRRLVGATDARFFRAKGSVAYGFGLFSASVTSEDLSTRFHGIDERVDVESLRLTTDAWLAITREFLA